mgnify:CR=1 FL=1
MENKVISEEQVKGVLNKLLSEQTSKVGRQEFNRVQFKIEELQNSLNETLKELRKLDESIPAGLRTVSNGRMTGISTNLSNTQKLLSQLKDKIRQYKRSIYAQQVEERKNREV